MTSTINLQRWWGDRDLDAGRCGRWQIGPAEFWLARGDHEWRFGIKPGDDAHESDVDYAEADLGHLVDDDTPTLRLGFRKTSGNLRLTPLLADRPVVVRPAQPIALPPQQELVLYFSSPLWLQVEVGDPLVEFLQTSLQRPSDTWFGANTREGELCYSLRTSARSQIADVPARPHRAVTEVHVVNHADTLLPIDRIRVPLPTMSLFAGASGQLWTQVITFERHDDEAHAELTLGAGPPVHASAEALVSGPRLEPPRGGLFRTFGSLIGGR
ncbi:MAG: hypothetical protein R3D98_13285 [Candidatus Krumholzibacteriia bacterium]